MSMSPYYSYSSLCINLFWFIFLNLWEFLSRLYQFHFLDNLAHLEHRRDLRMPKNPTCIVTGGNTGLGKETAAYLSNVGYHVIIACRSTTKGEKAVEDIHKTYPDLKGKLEVWPLDLSSLLSVKSFAERFTNTDLPLHLLVNNAGCILPKRAETENGIEETFQINHVGPFYLTHLLLPKLISGKSKGRVVNLSSVAHYAGHIDFDDLMVEDKTYIDMLAYGQAKLANILFTKELATQYGDKITTFAVHPGAVATEFYRTNWMGFIIPGFAKSPKEGARSSIYCSLIPESEIPNGSYVYGCGAHGTSIEAGDKEVAHKLWEITWNLIKKAGVETE